MAKLEIDDSNRKAVDLLKKLDAEGFKTVVIL